MLELIGTGLVQWDLDVQMRITTDQKVDEVHFANIGDAVALVVKPKTNNGETIVDVPNILLQTSRNLMAYVLADGRTIRRISFGIESKPKPEGYAYKETEILNYRTLEERIQILEKNVGGGTASITVDSALDKTSTNPVQNKAVAEAVDRLSEEIADLKDSEVTGISAELTGALRTYFANMQILLTQVAFITESNYGSKVIQNAKDIVLVLGGGTVEPEIGVSQSGSVLTITSGVTATQSGSVLAIL